MSAAGNKTTKLLLHKMQKMVLHNPSRFRVVVAGRRWGKTILSKVLLIQAAAAKRNQLVWYVAPSYQQARDIMWDDLKASIPPGWLARPPNETRMVLYLINGSKIMLKGADKPDSLRGVGLNFVVLDESQDMKPETWETVLQPTLATTNGRAIFIGTPKSFNWLHKRYVLGKRPRQVPDVHGKLSKNEWMSWQFPSISSPFIPRREIAARRRDMDPRSFRQEFEAKFEAMSGRVYYAFDRDKHVGDFPFNPALPIYVGMDFNIDPMSAIIIQEQPNGEIWVVDEIVLYGSNTQETADVMAQRYWRHMKQFSIYPDPAGNNRDNSRGETSLDILREVGFDRIFYKNKHPLVADRVNSVNRLFETADGTRRLFINSTCRKLIDSAEQTVYKEGTNEVDKKLSVEHAMDALGYYCDYRHPMRKVNILGVSL